MKTFAMIASASMIILSSIAESTTKLTAEERQIRKQKVLEIQMRRNGGMVRKAGSMSGSIAIVNAQTKVKEEAFAAVLGHLRKVLRMDIKWVNEEGVTLASAPEKFKNANANMCIFITEDNSIPGIILVMPENGWGILNISALSKGVGEEQFTSRVLKEMVRTFAIVSGAANSQYAHSLMGPVTKPEDLDTINSYHLPADMQSRIFSYTCAFGVKPYIQSTYLNACREGWAPAPTNDYQRAIWENIHSAKERGPVNALKIEPKKK